MLLRVSRIPLHGIVVAVDNSNARQDGRVHFGSVTVEGCPNHLEHVIRALHDVAVCKFQDADSPLLQLVPSIEIIADLLLARCVVRTPVEEDRDVGIAILGIDPRDETVADVAAHLKGWQRQTRCGESVEKFLLEKRLKLLVLELLIGQGGSADDPSESPNHLKAVKEPVVSLVPEVA